MPKPKVIKTMNLGELRSLLIDQMESLRDGQTTPANVNAMANVSGKFLQSIKLELEAHKLLGQAPNAIQGLLTQVQPNDENDDKAPVRLARSGA